MVLTIHPTTILCAESMILTGRKSLRGLLVITLVAGADMPAKA
jgi:hypothetical protein